MKVTRTKTELVIEVPESNERIEIIFPKTFVVTYDGTATLKIEADDLEYILGRLDFPLAALAKNALDAELYAKLTGKPRWLVYDTESGESYETPHRTKGAAKVIYRDGLFIWSN